MVAPLSQIEADLKEAKEKWPEARKIWASGGNPFALSTEKQIAVWDLMRTDLLPEGADFRVCHHF